MQQEMPDLDLWQAWHPDEVAQRLEGCPVPWSRFIGRLVDMNRFGRVWVGLALAAVLTACDRSAPPARSPTPVVTRVTAADPIPAATGPITAEGCLDGTVVTLSGAQGVIRAGPLSVNREFWRQEPDGTKFWVASTRDQPPVPAYIEARRLDGAAEPVMVERPVPLATPVPSVVPFYPGALRLPEPGRWKITVRIGPDNACFVVLVD